MDVSLAVAALAPPFFTAKSNFPAGVFSLKAACYAYVCVCFMINYHTHARVPCLRACMYVCMYVCMHACMCVFVCVCMHVWMHVCVCECMYVCIM